MSVPLLRTSERKTFKRCPQRWWWSYREGLRPVGPPSAALWFGTGWHLAMAHWYCGPGSKRGEDPIGVWRAYCDEEIRYIRTKFSDVQEYSEEQYVEARALGEAMLTDYLDRYGEDEDWDILVPEQTFQVLIPPPAFLNGDGTPIVEYVGTYDVVYRKRSTGDIHLADHKTAKAIFTGHLPLDDQAGGYLAVAEQQLRHEGIIRATERIRGITYNFVRKSLADKRPTNELGQALNKDGSISKVQPAQRFERIEVMRSRAEVRTQIQRVAVEALAMQGMRDNPRLLYKNPTKDCSWDCEFYHMCVLDEQRGDVPEYKEALYRVQDPYADHREDLSTGAEE